MYIYYPSCNFQRFFPETAKRIRAYLETQEDVTIAACCHKTSDLPKEGDTILTICMSCMHVLEERRPDIPGISLLQYLLRKEDFAWPDYKGQRMTLQDCFRARGYHELQDAVREVLKRMNVEIVEMPHNRDEETYDGNFLLHPPFPQNMEEAPKNYRDYVPQHVTVLPKEEWINVYKAQAAKYEVEPVVTYCNSCRNGLKEAGVSVHHIAEMIFPADRISRVQKYESLFDEALAQPNEENLRLLNEYYTSGQWLEDYEADERGEFPPDLKRGVLSQDALYDLLTEAKK